MKRFTRYCQNPKDMAQQNLWGLSHYCDDSTLRFHHSRVLECDIFGDGDYLCIIESYASNIENTERLYRYVIWDANGIVERPELLSGWKTATTARKKLKEAIEKITKKS